MLMILLDCFGVVLSQDFFAKNKQSLVFFNLISDVNWSFLFNQKMSMFSMFIFFEKQKQKNKKIKKKFIN